MRPGDEPQGVYFLKKGFVRLYSLSLKGEELTLIIFKPETFFPISWVVNNSVNAYYLEAMTRADLWKAPREELLKFLQENPDVFIDYVRRIAVRMDGLLNRMEYLAFGTAYAKVASILMILSDRFGQKDGYKVLVEVPLTHSGIASLVGVTRETASIELKKLEKKGLISYKKRQILVNNIVRLKKESLLSG